MIERDTKYRPGKRTFTYLCIKHGWWLVAIGAALMYAAYQMYFGGWQSATVQFLANHPTWYVDDGMLSQWVFLTGFAFLFVAYMRTSVLYRAYSFHLDEHALHLRRGIIRVQQITIPYQQITNIHIEQPYHWRLLGLAQFDVTISNSRTSLNIRRQRDFLIPCIDKSLAKALSQYLTREASGGEDEEDENDDEFEEEDGEDIVIE